jgi:hypothetical protein
VSRYALWRAQVVRPFFLASHQTRPRGRSLETLKRRKAKWKAARHGKPDWAFSFDPIETENFEGFVSLCYLAVE